MACTVLALDGVTLQELATMFPASDNDIDNDIANMDMNPPDVFMSQNFDHMENTNEACDNSLTGSIGLVRLIDIFTD
jgi:hypothetical protein